MYVYVKCMQIFIKDRKCSNDVSYFSKSNSKIALLASLLLDIFN